MTNQTPSQETPIEGTVFTPRQALMLKRAVIVMGIMLVVGFLALVGTMVYRASKLSSKTQEQTQSSAGLPRLPGAGDGVQATGSALKTLTLPDGATVSNISVGGNLLALHLSTPHGTEIMIVDIGSGKVLRQFTLHAKSP